MVGSGEKCDRGAAGSRQLQLSEHILRIRAVVLRPSRQGSHTRIARSHALPFGRQRTVGSAGANDDPVIVVATLGWKVERASKCCACLEFDRVSAVSISQSCLKVAARV